MSAWLQILTKYHNSYILAGLNYFNNATENKNFALGIFLDIAKAFDCVDHKILLYKLQQYGTRGIALQWFESHLSNHFQFVLNGANVSNYLPILKGVPRGSILGPILFILFIYDITNAVSAIKIVKYADETSVFISNSSLHELFFTSNDAFEKNLYLVHR